MFGGLCAAALLFQMDAVLWVTLRWRFSPGGAHQGRVP